MGRDLPQHRPALVPLGTCRARLPDRRHRSGIGTYLAGNRIMSMGAAGRAGARRDGRAFSVRCGCGGGAGNLGRLPGFVAQSGSDGVHSSMAYVNMLMCQFF